MSASNIANMLYIRVIVFTVNDGRGGAYVIEKKIEVHGAEPTKILFARGWI